MTNLNLIIQQSNTQIIQSTHLIITYGSAWVYRNKLSKKIVANCHKVPQNQFDKEILSAETIQKSIQNTINLIEKVNPTCNFLFTVSPVRHIKDGFVDNQRSKAHLITAIHNSQHTTRNTNYFPSYEIMMDELRDYRFYAKDMLHPSKTAIDYIWERFVETHIDETSYPIMEDVASIQKGLAHKPFNPNSKTHQHFLENLNHKIECLQKKIPSVIFYK